MKKIILILAVILMGCAAPKDCCAQLTVCDSLSYSIYPNTILTVTPSSGGISNVGAIDWNFTACNDVTCYIPQGNNPFTFPLINMSDTVKLCYDAYIYLLDSTLVYCTYCDSLVYNFNLFTWVVLSSNVVSINEVPLRITNNNIYDINGKVVTDLKNNTIYIRKNKKFIRL
jgi:hypothetical protein